MGWFSKIENPLVRDASIACWRLFSDLDLSAKPRKTDFKSLHDCFTRELKPGLRPLDPDPSIVASPSDAIVGAHSARSPTPNCSRSRAPTIRCSTCSAIPNWWTPTATAASSRLRLTSSMYHRFHAPADCRIERVTFISGDTWNVNPIALKRVERLFCKNERAVIRTRLGSGEVADAGAGRRHSGGEHPAAFPRPHAQRRRRRGPTVFPCESSVRKGDEMGWFEHGSTIIVLAPDHFEFCDNVSEGARIIAGQPLMRQARLKYPGGGFR